jgi:hypothetical protein
VIPVLPLVPPKGFLGTWLRYAEPYESPDSYFLFAMLGAAACAVNRRLKVNPEGEPSVFTNTYTILYGPSGSRKSTAIRHATWLLQKAVPAAPMFAKTFTCEALQDRMARESAARGKTTGIIITDEISDLIGGAEYRLGNSRFLTDIWDCPNVHPLETISRGYKEILNPYVSMLGASAPDWLEGIDPKTLAGGFLRRILLINELAPKRMNPAPIRDMVVFEALARMFAERLGPHAFQGMGMVLHADAQKEMDAWYAGYVQHTWNGANEKAGHFASCMQAHALKLGALIHVLEGRPPKMLEARSLVLAFRLIEAIVSPMFRAYNALVPTPFARLQAAILRILGGVGGSCHEGALTRMVKESTGQPPRMVYVAINSLVTDLVLNRDANTHIISEANR